MQPCTYNDNIQSLLHTSSYCPSSVHISILFLRASNYQSCSCWSFQSFGSIGNNFECVSSKFHYCRYSIFTEPKILLPSYCFSLFCEKIMKFSKFCQNILICYFYNLYMVSCSIGLQCFNKVAYHDQKIVHVT